MTTVKSILSALVLAGAMSSSIASAAGTAGIISSDAFAADSYCHMKFRAIDERTLDSEHPVLKDAGSGDVIDFYGPCDHDPLGKEEVQAQRRAWQRRRSLEYMD